MMKAMTRAGFGPPEALELREIDRPEPSDDEVLVRVRAASLNRYDWYNLTGTPWIGRPMTGLRGPKSPLIGADFAGTIETVGAEVVGLHPGDEVYGLRDGALAEFVQARAGVALKPANLSFEEAAAVPMAGLTALQGARDKAEIQAGQHVLVNGASGGVGTFAVQIAKALGAHVTAVCSTRNVEQASSIGADEVVDYTRDDFTRSGRRFEAILDVAGSRSWSELTRVLAPEGRVIVLGGPKGNRFIGPLGHMIGTKLAAIRGSQKAVFFVAKPNRADLDTLREMIEAGEVKPVVQQRFDLSELTDAFHLIGEGHTQGKLVISLSA
jgi:NADPH:quinone reductase-like Zn-dependent oxidoreductase